MGVDFTAYLTYGLNFGDREPIADVNDATDFEKLVIARDYNGDRMAYISAHLQPQLISDDFVNILTLRGAEFTVCFDELPIKLELPSQTLIDRYRRTLVKFCRRYGITMPHEPGWLLFVRIS